MAAGPLYMSKSSLRLRIFTVCAGFKVASSEKALRLATRTSVPHCACRHLLEEMFCLQNTVLVNRTKHLRLVFKLVFDTQRNWFNDDLVPHCAIKIPIGS